MSKNFLLVINFGSSSLKFSIFSLNTLQKKIFGVIEKINIKNTIAQWRIRKKKYFENIGDYISHKQSFDFMVHNIFKKQKKIFSRISCIGHRIVHAGSIVQNSCFITPKIFKEIKKSVSFSPTHNPIHLLGIKKCMEYFPDLKDKNIAVFDTTFHKNISEEAFLYAIPYKFYTKFGIRRYGAHGISHKYVSLKVAETLNKNIKQLNIISCHLGNGSSITAIKNGVSVDTSMGLTPLEGLVMGSRSGDIDPYIIFFMKKTLGLSLKKIEQILINRSGLLGLSGTTSDFRYLEKNYFFKKRAFRAINVFVYRLAKYISSYRVAIAGNVDAIVFTGGIGENSSLMRKLTILKLSCLGYKIDEKLNGYIKNGKEGFINKSNSPLILVISSKEEEFIAMETKDVFLNK